MVFYFLDKLSLDQLFSVKEACEHYFQLNFSDSCEETVTYNKYTKIVFDNFSEVLNCTTSLVDDYGTTYENSEVDINEKINLFLHNIQKNIEFIEFSYKVQNGKKRFEYFLENENVFYCSSLFEIDLNSMKYKKNIKILKEISDENGLLPDNFELLDIVDHTTLLVKEILITYKILFRLSVKSLFNFKICDTSFNQIKASKKYANWYGLLALEECKVSDISRSNEYIINLLEPNVNIRSGDFALIDSSYSFTLSTKCLVFLIEKEELSTLSANCETSNREFTSEFLLMGDDSEDKNNTSSSPEDKDSTSSSSVIIKDEIVLTVSEEYNYSNNISATQQQHMNNRRDSYGDINDVIINLIFNNKDNDSTVSTSNGNIIMTVEKFRCLKPESWLNDQVINFYMDLLQDRDKKNSKQGSKITSHFFNTFFMEKMFNSAQKYNYENVMRWTKSFNVFEKDKVFIPINRSNNHWILIVVFIQQQKIIYYDSIADVNKAKLYLYLTARWLIDEAKSKNHKIEINDWKLINAGKNIPQQNNGYDCGMYVLLYADYIADDLPLSYGEEEVSASRNKIAQFIINNKIPY